MAQTKSGKGGRGGKGRRDHAAKGFGPVGAWPPQQFPMGQFPAGQWPWFGGLPWPDMYPGMSGLPGMPPLSGGGTSMSSAAATDSLLDALGAGDSPGGDRPSGEDPAPRAQEAQPTRSGQQQQQQKANRSSWMSVGQARSPEKSPAGVLPHKALLGSWVDSQGNQVHVSSMDAYSVKLMAVLSKPPRHDIQLPLKAITAGGGWQCGHSVLDPVWTSLEQLHWVAMDGRVSVWVRPPPGDDDAEADEATKDVADPAATAAAAKEGAEDGEAHKPAADA